LEEYKMDESKKLNNVIINDKARILIKHVRKEELLNRVVRTRELGLGSVYIKVAETVDKLEIGPLYVAMEAAVVDVLPDLK
jgi:hypothetical protein